MSPRPDFIICGSMKCGTTTLHHLLDAHPDIFVAAGEGNYLAVDDYREYRPLFRVNRGAWVEPRYEPTSQLCHEWYNNRYAQAGPNQMLGEDSPLYISSRKAIDRILCEAPQTRIIITLRDPVDRCQSHYWHNVRTRRCSDSLEAAISHGPDSLVTRSFYLEQIKYLLERFSRDQIKVVIFEEWTRDSGETLRDIIMWLGLDPDQIPPHAFGQHQNRAHLSRYTRIALWENRLLRNLSGIHHLDFMPNMPAPESPKMWQSFLMRLIRIANPQASRPTPPMRDDTRAMLASLLRKENQGLDALLDLDLAKWWPSWRI